MPVVRRPHDGSHRQDVGVPPAAKDATGGVVKDQLVANVNPKGIRINKVLRAAKFNEASSIWVWLIGCELAQLAV